MENNLEKLFIDFIKKDKKSLQLAKEFAVDNKQYELVANLRDFEKEKYPIKDKHKKIIDRMIKLETAMRMCEIQSPHLKLIHTIDLCIKAYDQFKGNFDLKMAAKIVTESEEIFG